MGGYDAILAKHGISTGAKASGNGVVATATATTTTPHVNGVAAAGASGVSGAMGNLSLREGGVDTGGGGAGGTYAGELHALAPASVGPEHAPPVFMETRYRGYNVDDNRMRERLRRNAEKRGGSGE